MTENEDTFVICENMCLEPAYTKEQIDQKLESVDGVPTNVVVGFNSTTIPDGYEELEKEIVSCDGVVSDVYDNTSTYNIGDYCIYQDKLYRCITTVATAEVFDSNKWEQVNVTDEMNKGIDTFHFATTIVGSGNLASGAWRKIYTDINTGTIKKGTYLLFVPFTLAGASGSNGLATGRVMINGSESSKSSRQTLPVGTVSLLVSQTIIVLWEVTNEAEYTLNCEVYSSVNFSLRNTSGIELIKIK